MSSSVALPCGCNYTAEFENGDRGYTCPHRVRYIIKAKRILAAEYSVQIVEDPAHVVTPEEEELDGY